MTDYFIGIGGKKGHGKDAFAKALQNRLLVNMHGRPQKADVIRVSFAEVMYQAMHVVTGRDLSTLNRYQKEHEEIIPGNPKSTPRNLLQTFGTEWAREMIDPDFWIHMLARHLAVPNDPNRTRIIIISDVRFPNELDYVMEQNHRTFWVDATERVGAGEDQHKSENALDSVDFGHVVHNNKMLSDLTRIADIHSKRLLNLWL